MLFISKDRQKLSEIKSFLLSKKKTTKKFIAITKISLQQYWLKDKENTFLEICFYFNKNNLQFFITPKKISSYLEKKSIAGNSINDFFFEKLAAYFKSGIFDFLRGFFMQPKTINKPWGKEVWYSGIEERGVCLVKSIINDLTSPLPYVLEVFNIFNSRIKSRINSKINSQKKIILTKRLVPLAEKEKGNLYYELHQKKKEVYIVNEISKKAYPIKKIGKIKIGMNQSYFQKYSSFEKFKEDFLKISISCKKIIDQLFQEKKSNPKYQKLNEKKKKYFEKLEPFFRYVDLEVGDIIRISPFIPHSLQHGVSVVEFQTQHYERAILSFEQKVITQDHWDTKKALSLIKKKDIFASEYSFKNDVKVIQKKTPSNIIFEKIKGFDEFNIERITIEKDQFNLVEKNYCILFIVSGEIEIILQDKKKIIKKNQCFYLPQISLAKKFLLDFSLVEIKSKKKSILLKATP